MQTFLPYPNFVASALVLDRARLGKQRVECSQIVSNLRGLSVMGEPPGERRAGWSSHPAVKMWEGHLPALCLYMSVVIREWERRGYANSMVEPYAIDDEDRYVLDEAFHASASLPGYATDETIDLPHWLGDEKFHASHRSNLLRKSPEWYGQFGWSEQPGEEYVWPTRESADARRATEE